jgi:uncharacterized protein YjbI with pentapeptide repeats
LQDAFLRFAALSEADLEAADLTSADLVHARLDRANLRAANLSNAILDHADFAGANLSRANLSGASLDHAQNLTQAQIRESLGDELTILPSHLQAPESWLKTKDLNHTTSLTSDRSPKNSTATSLTDAAEGDEAVGIIASLSTDGSVVGAMPEVRHVEILRRGPQAWNTWRAENPSTLPLLTEVTPTLSERQLGPINGGPINLASACMRDAFLRFAALSEADLEAADLSQADLVHARLDRANLTAANLSNAILDHADFAGARLFRADLRGASLKDARNLTQEQINDSIGNASTIVPSHLKAPESWLQTNESSLLGPAPLGNLAPKGFNSFVSPKRVSVAWKAGLTGCGVALVVSGFIWLPTFWLYPQASREESVQTGAPKPIQSATYEEKHQASPSTSPTLATSEGTLEGSSPSVAAEPTVSSEPSAETMRSGQQSQSALDSESQHGEVLRHDSAPETAPSPLAPEFVPNEAAAGAPVVGFEEPAAVVVDAPNASVPELPGGSLTARSFPGELPPTGLAAKPHANDLLPESQIAAALRLGLPDGGLVVITPTDSLSNDHLRAAAAPLPLSGKATTLAHTGETPPLPVRKPLVQKSQAALQKGESDSRPSPRGRVKAPTLADKGRVTDKKPEPVTGSNATGDVLAGGL